MLIKCKKTRKTCSRVSFYIFTIHWCNITALVQNWKISVLFTGSVS